VVICGDFNEPSHLDWTQSAAEAGMHPLAVNFPASRKLAEAGYIDAYRTFWPDEVSHPGFTWSPLTKMDDPEDHPDRIDFIYFRSANLRLVSVEVVGESAAHADIVVDRWPSDHRAVRALVKF
jgi:exonuclease III